MKRMQLEVKENESTMEEKAARARGRLLAQYEKEMTEKFRDEDPDDNFNEEDSENDEEDDERNSNIKINLNYSVLVVGDFVLVLKKDHEGTTLTYIQISGQNWK